MGWQTFHLPQELGQNRAGGHLQAGKADLTGALGAPRRGEARCSRRVLGVSPRSASSGLCDLGHATPFWSPCPEMRVPSYMASELLRLVKHTQ